MPSLTLSGRIESSLRYSPFRQAGSRARDQIAEVPVQERDRGTATDETLIAWAAAGDRLAFDHLCTRQLPLLYSAALRVTGRPAEAEEVAQEAMLRAWRDAGRFDPRKAKLSTWLYRIAVNLAIDRARRPGEYRGAAPWRRRCGRRTRSRTRRRRWRRGRTGRRWRPRCGNCRPGSGRRWRWPMTRA
ncbi:sigma-70 family RNA polymerase sigma factor [Roseomonas gilardii]|uniref:sigma-70 family RNA polymerase sigma factor n=1 Tax=Roseomonas gilardii TaxID=257708 RepID=UPI000E076E57|nr:sigma-70 family RNA polymerase sigma factor [Roseomonas gilardii]SUE63055.1 RNA polymerase sigma factor [Roseomonas gilardii subsp. rosea]